MSVAVLAVTGSVCAQAVQWAEAEGGNGHWYQLVEKVGGWNACRDAAIAVGGDLCSHDSLMEDEFISYLVPLEEPGIAWNRVYTGATQAEGSNPTEGWSWVDGSPWTDTNWHTGQPNGGEGHLSVSNWIGEGFGWDDHVEDSSDINFYLIEWSADCNDDGIVDYGQILDGTFEDADGNGVPDCCDAGTPCDTPANAPVQWIEAEGGNGHWYQFTWLQTGCIDFSVDQAAQLGAHLVTVTSNEENMFIEPLIPNYNGGYSVARLGGFRTPESGNPEEGWYWITGETWDFTAWSPHNDQPNDDVGIDEDWLTLYPSQHSGGWAGWHDSSGIECDNNEGEQAWIIEWSADCNGDGIVDYGQIIDGTFEDADGNGVPDCCDDDVPCFPCPGDIVGNDGVVGVDDLLFVIAAYGQTNVPADLDGDGVVDVHDILLILEYWGDCP
jgi:hypothetical protein